MSAAPGTASKFDPDFTKNVVESFGPKSTPRIRQLLGSLITHIHDFARETELTTEEWMIGVHFVNSIGQTSTPIRNEAHRLCDVIGLESLVDEIANKHITENGDFPTSSTILGPFWSPRAPFRELGDNIMQDETPGCHPALMHGTVIDIDTKKGIPGAVVDIWEASSNGKYDFQDPENQSDNNLRGKFRTDENGNYHFYMLKPTAYSLPTDGPAGVVLRAIDRHPWRPAHVHLMISHPDFKPVTTQIYPRDDPYVTSDSVFAVKDDLLIDFTPRENDPKAKLDLLYNVKLAPRKSTSTSDPSNTVGLKMK